MRLNMFTKNLSISARRPLYFSPFCLVLSSVMATTPTSSCAARRRPTMPKFSRCCCRMSLQRTWPAELHGGCRTLAAIGHQSLNFQRLLPPWCRCYAPICRRGTRMEAAAAAAAMQPAPFESAGLSAIKKKLAPPNIPKPPQ